MTALKPFSVPEGTPLPNVPTDFQVDVWELYEQARDLLLRKHNDYGPRNISDAPGGALNGLLVRMHDKQSRLRHLHEHGGGAVDEPLEETLLDLANYALIGVLVLRGKWPGATR